MDKDGQTWTDRQTNRQTDRQTDRQLCKDKPVVERLIDKWINWQTDRQMDTGRQTDLVSDILPAGAPQSFGTDGLPHNRCVHFKEARSSMLFDGELLDVSIHLLR